MALSPSKMCAFCIMVFVLTAGNVAAQVQQITFTGTAWNDHLNAPQGQLSIQLKFAGQNPAGQFRGSARGVTDNNGVYRITIRVSSDSTWVHGDLWGLNYVPTGQRWVGRNGEVSYDWTGTAPPPTLASVTTAIIGDFGSSRFIALIKQRQAALAKTYRRK